jgi:eukaryotic-like serine/threonine-protein kinase
MPLEFSDPLVGTVVDGKYQIAERLGAGGMGTVYKAIHVSLGAPRALKVMRRELAGDAALAARFRTEARLAEGLRHPHLVALYDFGQLPGGGWYIVSEFVEGATVAVLLKRRGARFCSTDVATFVGQVADGLAVAHRRGVVHRDISPDNIMLTTADDEVAAKLLDFGIAKEVLRPPTEAMTGVGWNVGKIGFSSPEQMGLLREGEVIDGRCDLFSLAAVAYLMIAGRLPWRKDSVQAYTHDLLLRPEEEAQDEIRAHVAAPWHEVFGRALARSREARFPSLSVFKDALTQAARSREALGGEGPPFLSDMLRSSSRGDAVSAYDTRTLQTESPAPAQASESAQPPVTATVPTAPTATATPSRVLVPSAMLLEHMLASMQTDAAAVQEPATRPPDDPVVTRRFVVVLDDDAALRAVLPRLLAGPDLDVTAAPWLAHRDALADGRRPDLMLVDPGAGEEIAEVRLRALRDASPLGAVPFVLFSSADEWALRALARRSGAAGHLPKEAMAGDFAGAVRRFFAPVARNGPPHG